MSSLIREIFQDKMNEEEIVAIFNKGMEESQAKLDELMEIQKKTKYEMSKVKAEMSRKEKAKNLYIGKKTYKKKKDKEEQ